VHLPVIFVICAQCHLLAKRISLLQFT